jgi:hypothetical protein
MKELTCEGVKYIVPQLNRGDDVVVFGITYRKAS